MKRFIYFLFCMLCFVAANGQQREKNFKEAMDAGKKLLRDSSYTEAINKFFAAEAFDPGKKAEVKEMVDSTFRVIVRLKDKATAAEANAVKAKKNADKLRREAYMARDEANATLDENNKLKTAFFYNAIAIEVAKYNPTVALIIARAALRKTNGEFELFKQTAADIYENNAFYKIVETVDSNITDSEVWDTYKFEGKIDSSFAIKPVITSAVSKGFTIIDKPVEKIKIDSSRIIKDENISSYTVSLAGDKILTGYKNGVVKLWDAKGNRLMEFKGHTKEVNLVGFKAADPDVVLTYSAKDGTVRSWTFHVNSINEKNVEIIKLLYPVKAVALSPFDNTILAVTEDGTAGIYDNKGKEEKKFKKNFEDERINNIIFSPTGDKYLTTSNDALVRLWDAQTGNIIQEFPETNSVSSIAFSQTGDSILTGSEDGTVTLWNLKGENLKTYIGHHTSVWKVEFSPAGNMILTNSLDTTARLWDLKNTVKPIKEFNDQITTATFSPTGDSVVTGSIDGATVLWDLKKDKAFKLINSSGIVYYVSLSPDGNIVIITDREGVQLYDLRKKGLINPNIDGESITSIVFSPDSKKVLVRFDQGVILWDMEGDSIYRSFEELNDLVVSATFSPTGDTILARFSDGNILLYDVQSGSELKEYHTFSKYPISDVQFSPDGETIIIKSYDDNYIPNYELRGLDWKLKKAFVSASKILSVAYSPDSTKKSILTGSDDGHVTLWAVENESVIQTFMGHSGAVHSLAFSPTGDTILTGSSDGSAILWNVNTGDTIRTLMAPDEEYGHKQILSIAFSPDGQKILAGLSDGGAVLWNLKGDSISKIFSEHYYAVNAVAFSPSGDKILTGSSDASAVLQDVETGEVNSQFVGSMDGISSVAFSPTGDTILTGSYDGFAYLWKRDGTLIKKYSNNGENEINDPINAVAFAPDGHTFITGSDDYTIHRWERPITSFEEFLEGGTFEEFTLKQIDRIQSFTSSDDIDRVSISAIKKFSKDFVDSPEGGPRGYKWCADEDRSYTFEDSVDVAYGAENVFKYKTNVTGTIYFNNETFGDPVPGVVKAGYYKLHK